MAKKKRKSSGDKAGGRKRDKPDKKAKSASAPEAGTPKELARELLLQAQFTDDLAEQADLAQKALALDPDSADACVLLAEAAPSKRETLRLYEQAVAVAQRALDARPTGPVGDEAEAYLRARRGLAFTLWLHGRRDEAIAQAAEMLGQDRGDFFGLRYTLLGWLLSEDRDAEALQLLESHPEDESAAWAYTRALLAFRQHGDTAETQKLLKRARKINKHVPAYLLGDKEPPAEMPDHYVPGDPSEALQYLGSFLAAWRNTAGALDFLRLAAPSGRKKQDRPPELIGPTEASKKQLGRLEQRVEVWQIDCRQLPSWVPDGGRRVRPWLVLVSNLGSDQVVGSNTSGPEPTPELIWDTLAQAMREPLMDTPHRPTTIQYPTNRPWQELAPHLEEIDVRLSPEESLAETDEVFPNLIEQLVGKPQPGLLDVPGVKPERVGQFYEAAASYFRQAPWRRVGYESAVEVRCDKFSGGPWYAVVMGQSGMTFGLALYEDLAVLRQMWAQDAPNEENARRTVATTVTFGEAADVPVADLEAAERHGWTVARPDAYPAIFHKERGLALRPPLAWELELMEACLRALPDFVRRRPQDDTTPEQVTVNAGGGTLPLTLAWVGDEPARGAGGSPAGRQAGGPPAPRPEDPDRDYLLDAAMEHWSVIRQAYRQFEDKKPIVLYDIQDKRVYVYPYEEFKADLSPRSQGMLTTQYRDALRDGKVVLFVRDNEERRLVSFSLDLEE